MIRAFLMRTAAWIAALAFVIGIVGLLGDTIRLLAHGATPTTALVTGLTGMALGVVIAVVIAPVLTLIARLSGWMAARKSVVRVFWPLPVAVSAWFAAALISGGSLMPHKATYTWVLGGFTAAIVLSALLARAPRFRPRVGIAVSLVAIAFLFDLALPKDLYRNLHDLAGLTIMTAGLALTTRLRARVWQMAPARALLLVAGLGWFAATELALVDQASPGWRAQALAAEAYEMRLARGARTLIDFDADGFSSHFWGTDCDDFDERRNPYRPERAGGPDDNCNGTSPPYRPTDTDRGLQPPFGSPDLEPGTIDRVLLITIDCLRADAFRADVMPRLTAFATQGQVMGRMYAGGSRTFLSLPFIQHPFEGAKSVAKRLAQHKISGTAVLPFYEEQVSPAVIDGFGEIISPAFGELWKAPRVTELALRDLARHPKQHYLWVHYFDAHDELKAPKKNPPVRFTPEVHRSYGLYLEALSRIDEEAGRLLNALKADGRLARTVVIITGDHGEGFGEHGTIYHGAGAYEVLLRVPGAIVGPGIRPGRYAELSTHRDLPATLLGAWGLASGDGEIERYGRSWLRLRNGGAPAQHSFVVSRSARRMHGNEGIMPMASIVEGRLKFMETFEDGLVEMYDVLDDPAEADELASVRPVDAARLRKHLALFRDLDGYPRPPRE